MEKEITLFQKDDLTFKLKFYTLIDLLITNQAESRFETYLLMGIFYTQIISSFFSNQIGVFDSEKYKSDNILGIIEKLVRIKGLFRDNYEELKKIEIFLFIIFILIIFHFIISCFNISTNSFYSNNNAFINYYIKIFLYIAYNIILDICFSNFCLGSNDLNPNFTSVNCSVNGKIVIIIISILFILFSVCVYIYINIYYNDSFYLSYSYYAKMSCNYDTYWGLNCLAISCLSTQVKFITKDLFLIYNFFISLILFFYYLRHYLFYDKYINCFTGSFHILYVWTSVFCLIFAYIDFTEKGIVYIITSIIVCFFYKNIKNRIESKIFLDTPFFKINNEFYLLYYFYNLIDKINNINENSKDRSFLSGIIQIHITECPSPNCMLKNKEDLYLPSINKWFKWDDKINEIDDEVFLKNFIIIVMNYFLTIHKCTVDMYLNLSLYYLKIIGNYCQAIYFYKKVTELKLTLKEYFSFIRLSIQISKKLIEKFKPSNEPCTELENLDVSIYYKYDSLSHRFLNEIDNDINLSLEFWKSFRYYQKDSKKIIDFNKIFKLTDKIRITKINIESMWNNLLKIYGGINEYFQLYMDYVEQINDDDLKKRDLETIKRKNDNYGDNINNNYYSVLFNNETGIIIANGDKGNEGIIQLANNQIENIFKYKNIELKGMNLTNIMPKIFAKNHSKYIERYFKIGEKRIIDKPKLRLYAKDKNNSIIKISIVIKLFPVLNENVYFVSLIKKENFDDIILLDNNFIIQGMSSKIIKILNINNLSLFEDNEIPFYMICKKFLNFYNIFLKCKPKKENLNLESQIYLYDEEKSKEKFEKIETDIKLFKENIFENIEINENVELEYEIKLPKFLIDYSEKTNKNINIEAQITNTREDNNDSNDESDEKDLLLKNEKNKNISTPAPYEETIYDAITPINNNNIDFDTINELTNVEFNKLSEEEKIYNEQMLNYVSLFNQGKISELEDLIEKWNKDSLSIEYKFNFTFKKFMYENNKIGYIVRCIDNKNDFDNYEEESSDELDLIRYYKKENVASIKRLYEILNEEKNEILEMPKIFLQLSIEDQKFNNLLIKCKNDIINMSKIHGQKNEIILEDENTSQKHQSGFDTKLIKKNRIEEIRSNLLMNISKFYALKYIKITFFLFAIFTAIFSFFYIYLFSSLYYKLKNSSFLNINLYQSTLLTTEMLSIFISFRTLYEKYIINFNDSSSNYFFYDYLTNSNKINSLNNNSLYYNQCISMISELYNKSTKNFEYLETKIPNYIKKEQIIVLYWNRINITYMDETYFNYSKMKNNETFPMAIDQFISNVIYFIENDIFNSIENNNVKKFYDKIDINKIYFYYMTYIIIENGYDNLLPNQIDKLLNFPQILNNYNSNQKLYIIILVISYFFGLIIIYLLYCFLLVLTNKSMTNGIQKITRIQQEKIEEIIKRIKLFNINLKRFREKDIKIYDEKNKKNSKVEIENNQILKRFQTAYSEKGNNIMKKEKKSTSLNNSGFNSDNNKKIGLNILKYSFFPPLIIFLINCICLIPVFIVTMNIIDNTNQLLLAQNYIFGRLISTSIKTIEIKCFISDCKNKTSLDYSELVKIDSIQDIIKAVTIFPDLNKFYNEKFLFNACGAALDEEKEPEKYQKCKNDIIIINSNNTDNLIKLIDDFVHNIKKEYEMEISIRNNNYSNFNKKSLYNLTYFRNIEYIFYNYIYTVGDNFENIIIKDFDKYLLNNKIINSIVVICIGIGNIIFFLIFEIILLNNLIHYLSVSRCIMKIIPTSIIISTQELEDWIESKY